MQSNRIYSSSMSVDQMVLKIIDLEQQLSTTKVELAVKSAELLVKSLQFRLQTSSIIRRTRIQREDKL